MTADAVADTFDPQWQPWIQAGFTGREARRWVDNGLSIQAALIYESAGYAPASGLPRKDLVAIWKDNGWDLSDIHAWQDADFLTSTKWRAAGASVEVAVELNLRRIHPWEWSTAVSAGADPDNVESVSAWHREEWGYRGDSAPDKSHRRTRDRSRTEHFPVFREAGCSTRSEALRWIEVIGDHQRRGLDLEDLLMSPGGWITHTQPKVLNRVLSRFEPGDELVYVEEFEAPYVYARCQRLADAVFNNRSLSAARAEAKIFGAWRDSGVPNPPRWIDAGATPAQAAEWHDAGIDSTRFAQVGTRGWTSAETREWMPALRFHGLYGAVAAHDLGRSPAQMSPTV